MSIQDESFPNDEFFDELNFSSTAAGRRYQFPHLQREQRVAQKITPAPNTSSSSPSSNESQNSSNGSSNGRSGSVMSAKTSASDPTGLEDDKKKSGFVELAQNKASSYQDIHSDYTKRRYKHVESKVGQYIAQMKAEDRKRRNSAKFQRHQSLPETLTSAGALSLTENNNRKPHRFSTVEVRTMDESISDEAEAEADSLGNMTRTTSGSSSQGRHESSDDAGTTACDFIDKMAYAQLLSEKDRIQSYSDYLQTRLDEKSGENIRLKRNVDFMRIELTNCQDKLKKQMNQMGGGMSFYGSAGSITGVASGRQSLQALIYCQAKSTKATQTEVTTPAPAPPAVLPLLARDIYVTPDTSDANNNVFESGGVGIAEVGSNMVRTGKTVATVQPLSLNFSSITEVESGQEQNERSGVLRQRTNSNPRRKTPSNQHDTGNSYPSSSDSAIDIESAELGSPKTGARKLQSSPATLPRELSVSSEELIYYDKRSARYATLEAMNVTVSSSIGEEPSGMDMSRINVTRGKTGAGKKNSLRRRWLRFLAPCVRCKDPNHSVLDSSASALQQTYTQIPLLEKSSGNDCSTSR